MRTRFPTLRSVALVAALHSLGPAAIGSTDAALYIDGKIRADGVELQGASVLVERNGTIIQFLTKDIARINLRLDLQRVYILTFEHAGCLTKKLRFDTHVPLASMDKAPFTFPFKVTLVKAAAEAGLEYAQPVGYIRFFKGRDDFGYDTNFTLRQVEGEEEDLIAADASSRDAAPAVEAPSPSSVPATPAMGMTAPVEDAAPGATSKATLPAAGSPSAAHASPMPSTRTRPMPAVERRSAAATLPMSRTTSTPKVKSSPLGAGGAARTVQSATLRTVVRPPLPAPVVLPDGRTEELLVDKTQVTTIVRITQAGRTREYRRVVHHYGDVHYFLNGTSCGEATYRSGILEP